MRSTNSCVFPTLVLLGYACVHCSAGDLWSPGTQPEAWQRITRLQRVCVTTPVRSPFVSQCCQGDDPVERLAAIAWIGRTKSRHHIPDLELLLSDPVRHVRQLALECLCLLNCPEARQVIAHTVATTEEISTFALRGIGYRRYTPCGNDPWRLINEVMGLELKDRQAALARRRNQEWIKSAETPCANVFDIAITLERSMCDRNQLLEVTLSPQAGPGRPIAIESLTLQRQGDLLWVKADQTHTDAQAKLNHVANGLYRFQLNASQGPVSPGIYAICLRTTQWTESSLTGLPFFIRINRSQPDENEIPELLGRVDELPVVKRLGELRVREAVPSLMAHFKKAKDCEQMQVANALALIGDGRAAEAFLDFEWLTCWDSGADTDTFLNALDNTSQVYCVDYLDRALERWNLADDDERLEPQKILPGFSTAVAMMNRPLTEQHKKTVEWILQQQLDSAKDSDAASSTQHYRIAKLLVDYSQGDLQILAMWLTKLEEHPEVYLGTLEAIRNDQNNPQIRLIRLTRSKYDELLQYMEDWLRRKPHPGAISHRANQLRHNWHFEP